MGLHIDLHALDPRHLGHQVEHGLGQLDPHKLQEFIRHELAHTLEEAASFAAREAFRMSTETARKLRNKLSAVRSSKPALIEAVDQVSFRLNLSVLTLHYSGFYARSEGLCAFLESMSQSFELTRSKVRYVIENTGPDNYDFDINGQLFTSALSAGAGVTVPTALIAELVDMVLAEVGVPE